MALRPEVVHLVGVHLLHHVNQVRGIGEIAVMQHEAAAPVVRILVQMVDPVGVEQRGPALDAMDGVALAEQEFGQVGAILAGDTGDECGFGHGGPSGGCESDVELFEAFASPGTLDRGEIMTSQILYA